MHLDTSAAQSAGPRIQGGVGTTSEGALSEERMCSLINAVCVQVGQGGEEERAEVLEPRGPGCSPALSPWSAATRDLHESYKPGLYKVQNQTKLPCAVRSQEESIPATGRIPATGGG